MKRAALALALGATALLQACIVVPAHRAGYYDGGSTVVIDTPPPPLYAEAVPVMPYPGAVWINGYWGWSGGRHQWVPGYYERPRPGYRHEPSHWESHGGRWHLRLGGWIRL